MKADQVARVGFWTPWLFLSPFVTLFIIFMIVPAVAGVLISFSEWDILGTPQYNGLDNYRQIFADPLFWESVINTFVFMVITAVPLVLLGLEAGAAAQSRPLRHAAGAHDRLHALRADGLGGRRAVDLDVREHRWAGELLHPVFRV